MSKALRNVKNITKGYSSVQVKVRNATSNDPWGPVGSDMADIAQMTYNNSSDFYEIMDMLDKRLNDKGKNWRHVLKSLKVLDYCLHEGSELVVTWARKNVYIIKTLREFQYIDEDGRDVGQNVRISAKELTSLILDEERLRIERQDRKSWKSRVTGIEEFGPPDPYGLGEGSRPSRPGEQRNRRQDEEDLEYKLAIEASKNEAEEEKRRRERELGHQDDDDLAKAIKLSKEEEDSRRRELEESNAASLFDDTPSQTVAQPTGYNQGYQQQGAVDWFGNPIDPQQQQNTGYLNNMYTQPTGVPYQQTGYQNGADYSAFQQPSQPTGYDQFQQQQQQQANHLQNQQTAFNMNNPYAQQPTGFGNPGLQQQQNAQNPVLQAGSNNPWSTNGLQQSADALKPAPTGSNNPFAASLNRPSSANASRPPTLSTLQEQKTQSQFNSSSYKPPTTTFALQEQPLQNQPLKEVDPHRAQLNTLLATGEGQDTFGNTGQLRIPAQHTAPGTFVNSAGAGADRIGASVTGANPFMNTQFTGFQQPQTRIVPAQTGPVGAFGANNNPFGGPSPFAPQQRQQYQHQQSVQAQQGGSLIDL